MKTSFTVPEGRYLVLVSDGFGPAGDPLSDLVDRVNDVDDAIKSINNFNYDPEHSVVNQGPYESGIYRTCRIFDLQLNCTVPTITLEHNDGRRGLVTKDQRNTHPEFFYKKAE